MPLLPGVLALLLAVCPWIDRRIVGAGRGEPDILDHPLARPARAVLLTALVTVMAVLTVGATADVVAKTLQASVESVIWTLRALLVLGPVVAAAVVGRIARRR